ncbi:tryptophan halogenase family protein [Hirschia litorea]|uniref:Tryptophan halogenase family protein n=1 Tax=Hirschia litorea TaxID=1199156 RepID=A0ABW2IPT5_9PROT
MSNSKVKTILIVGGGTAGWMTAIAIASVLKQDNVQITLIESREVGIVGVGEATLPHIRYFIQSLGIDEREFVAATDATIKLGIEFVDWGCKGDRYIHPFGEYGLPNDGIAFHHFYNKFKEMSPICDYSLPVVAAKKGKFYPPSKNLSSVNSTYQFAYQFDATKFAPFLRKKSEKLGVKRVEGKIIDVKKHADGNIASVSTEDGRCLEADFFVDCSGFSGLLVDKALGTKWQSWAEWLPCNRAVVAPCEHAGPLLPYTRATAKEFGWQWRIPLQTRTGNGYVYSSQFAKDVEVEEQFASSLEGDMLADLRVLRFETGRREKFWNRNCVSIGLSGGFLEPLESTSIYLIQQGITYFLELFPEDVESPIRANEYNRMMDMEFERIRDFLILHYYATEREDSSFWKHMKNLKIPHSLSEKIELFRERGYVESYKYGLFLEPSWVAVYYGQGIIPCNYDSRVDLFPSHEIETNLNKLRRHIEIAANNMMSHDRWLKQYIESFSTGRLN